VAAELVHATAIALGGRAALIRGPSGAGKSDLALRCLALPPSALLPDAAQLVSDDQVHLELREGAIHARAPATIAGLIEVRGIGILRLDKFAVEAQVTLAVDLQSPHDSAPERYPDPWPHVVLLGVTLPLLRLQPFEASAPVKLLLALRNGPEGFGM
jgi:serine kinase of HPr protein (carbohydrate metabolism regulator)